MWIRGRADIYRAAHQEVGIIGKQIGPLIADANSSAIWFSTTVGVGLRRVARDVRFFLKRSLRHVEFPGFNSPLSARSGH